MKDETPARARRTEPQPDPILDTSGDSEEPAFSWMTGGAGAGSSAADGTREAGSSAADGTREAGSAEAAGTESGGTESGRPGLPGGPRRPITDEDAAMPVHAGTAGSSAAAATAAAAAAAAAAGAAAPRARKVDQPESRADRKAAEAAVEEPEPAASDGSSAVFREQLPTSALQVRPPEEEVERRNAQRESAANAKPVAPRVMQVLLAIFFPLVLLILAVRAVTSPLFLWVEYNRPGFPGDGYGFSTDDRMTYGSYAVDYLNNWAGPRYLGDLVYRSGDKLFKDGEVSHMADVKLVILSAFGAGVLLVLVSLIAILYLRRRSSGGVRRGLFAGAIITLVLILGLGTLAVLGWQQFFTEFHRIFFAEGSWTFSMDDTLIRLFPGQFWIDAGMVIAGLVLVTALVTLVLTWPTRRRRGLVKDSAGAAGDHSADQA
ncbi:integral membrane protein (TIGR01906 family) [Arthrobacter sp. SLBN-100]|uniref:TIGR01906 family membrane protein n=1 Tax=Arthrobacter sp. SLBN-100 TaxID=2768450 RepID=UPI0011530EB7|nr:TIGR01906 family membrane protein [Arthrobacter sp. SLBN-100]TQJ69924.1 integral membrane protein (TIGR01906 family) [Arthrobacter sp. SLBN-100]